MSADSSHTTVTPSTVRHMASLANIPITSKEEEKLAKEFATTLNVVNNLKKIKTDSIEPTHQVTSLINVFREDVVDMDSMFTQKQALLNSQDTHNGYVVAKQVREEK